MSADADLLLALETHSVEGLRAVLDAGLDPCAPVRGKTPVTWLTEMYLRSDRFAPCLRLLLDRGARLEDAIVAPVLLDDPEARARLLREDVSALAHRTTLVSAFTPLEGASLLHVAAEYGHARVARVLIESGADVNARAARDRDGLNGHAPIFHCVNSHENRSEPVLRLLLEAGADAGMRVDGITWGRGFEWETTCFDVTPVSWRGMAATERGCVGGAAARIAGGTSRSPLGRRGGPPASPLPATRFARVTGAASTSCQMGGS